MSMCDSKNSGREEEIKPESKHIRGRHVLNFFTAFIFVMGNCYFFMYKINYFSNSLGHNDMHLLPMK